MTSRGALRFVALAAILALTTVRPALGAGACCHPVDACSVVDEGPCEAGGGSFLGEGTSCGGDSDADGVSDACDNCPEDPNGPDAGRDDQQDSDSDGPGDACDACKRDPANDADSDLICGDVDNCPGEPNPDQDDSDLDGTGTACDNCPELGNDQTDGDTDGVGDPCDNCAASSNGAQEDADSDGPGDACDACPLDPMNDAESDGVCADVDNCPGVENGGQEDRDSDAVGDACDNCDAAANGDQSDRDSDAAGDACDNCADLSNSEQEDADSDGAGDACEDCDLDAENDADSDGVCGDLDNCPSTANDGQEDGDSDGPGDACDACPLDAQDDSDSDGHCADVDNCPADANAGQEDADSDGRGNACDACRFDAEDDADSDGHCADGDNCPAEANAGQEDSDSDGVGDTCDACELDPANDADSDGYCGDEDNCPGIANDGQGDADSDDVGDACDNCREAANAGQEDGDTDLVGDACDNCPEEGNAGQDDSDSDGPGDACDDCPLDPQDDADSDSVCGDRDNCPTEGNGSQADSDSDGPGDACDDCPRDADDDADSDGVCGDTDNCPALANDAQEDADSDLTGDVCDPCAFDPLEDADSDGRCGDVDNCPGDANPEQDDSDSDDVGDACDNCRDTDNDQADGDSDTVGDACDNCAAAPNAMQQDFDSDGLGNACDGCPFDGQNDADSDSVCGNVDNCPLAENGAQEDSDGDGAGDACDPCTLDPDDDADSDSVCGDGDNCPATANPAQADTDSDGPGDACDPCPLDPEDDADSDGACGDADNCPATPNGPLAGPEDQGDRDGDGRGDACDGCPRVQNVNAAALDCNEDGDSEDEGEGEGEQCDRDEDGVPDACDNCPVVQNGPGGGPDDQRDSDTDGVGDACAFADRDGDGVRDGLDNCVLIRNGELEDGQADSDSDGTGDACDVCPGDVDGAQADADSDGVGDACDNCPTVANGNAGDAQADFDSDGAGEACDNCPVDPNPLQRDADFDGTGDECEAVRNLPPEIVSLRILEEPERIRVSARDPDGSVVAFEIGHDAPFLPGEGRTLEVLEPAGEVTVEAELVLAGLATGRHRLLVRARDAEGAWSLLRDTQVIVSEGPIPIVLIQGYDFGAGGPHLQQLEAWKETLTAELRRPVFFARNQDSWASAAENAVGVEQAVNLALLQTRAPVADLAAWDSGGLVALAYLARDGAGERTRRLVAVGTPWLGRSDADALLAELRADAASGDQDAAERLARDRALPELTRAGAEELRSTLPGLAAYPEVELVLVGGRRPPGSSDDAVELSSALGLPGASALRLYESASAGLPMHSTTLLMDQDFIASTVVPSLGGEEVTLSGAGGPMRGPFAPAPAHPTPMLSGAGGASRHELLPGPAEALRFTAGSSAGDLSLTLGTPDGRLVLDRDAELEPDVSFEGGGSASGPGIGRFGLVAPAAGPVTVDLVAALGSFTFSQLEVFGGVSMEAGVSEAPLLAGETTDVFVSFSPPRTLVDRVLVTFLRPDGSTDLRELVDGSGASREGLLDLPALPSLSGGWTGLVEAEGRLDGLSWRRASAFHFDVVQPGIAATGAASDRLVDLDDDGQPDALRIDVEVEVTSPGSYALTATLRAPDGSLAGQAGSTLSSAEAGLHEVALFFDGERLASPGVPGRFALAELVLSRLGERPGVLGRLADVHVTRSVDVAALDRSRAPSLRLTSPSPPGALAEGRFTLTWEDADLDDDAVIDLYRGPLPDSLEGGEAIALGISEDSPVDSLDWMLEDVPPGTWFVHGVISDGTSRRVAHAGAPLTIGADSDSDGLLDAYEESHGLDAGRHDADFDEDGDSLSNAFEAGIGTSPSSADTDGGGEPDDRELRYGRDAAGDGTDDIVLPADFRLGDVGPGSPDGAVTIADVVQLLRFAVLLDSPDGELLLRGDIAPAVPSGLLATPPRFRRLGDRRIDIGDVTLALRVSVGLVELADRR